jgi:hypothetical protein
MDKEIARPDLLLEMAHHVEVGLAAARYVDTAYDELGVEGPSIARRFLEAQKQLDLALAGRMALAMTAEELTAKTKMVRQQCKATAREARFLRVVLTVGRFLAGDPRQVREQAAAEAPVTPGILLAVSLATAALWLACLR